MANGPGSGCVVGGLTEETSLQPARPRTQIHKIVVVPKQDLVNALRIELATPLKTTMEICHLSDTSGRPLPYCYWYLVKHQCTEKSTLSFPRDSRELRMILRAHEMPWALPSIS